jgi:type IV pilus assembly protein PilM
MSNRPVQDRRFDAPASPISMPSELAVAECHNCRARNDGERRFCKECGAPLQGPCPECGETVGLAEKFCGGCGFAVGETFHERVQAAQAMLNEGVALRSAAQFAQAQQLLRRLAADTDPLLYGLRRRAEQESKQCDATLNESERLRDELLDGARTAMEHADFDRAAALLEQVPEGIRTEEVRQSLTRAAAFRDEAEQLVRAIREALAAKEYFGLLPKVERLLVLKPQHEQARAMVGKLRVLEHEGQGDRRDRNLALAKQRLAESRADEAVELLEQIPVDMRTPDVLKALDFAREAVWLSRQLRSALVLTETLCRLGDKLAKLQPADGAAAKLVEQLKQRRAAQSAAGFAIPLRALPEKPAVGCKVEIVSGWKRITATTEVKAVLGTRFEQFCTAAGLALEGLGKAAICPKLKLESSDKLWQRLSRAVRKRDANVAWGIDLGTLSLKALRLRLNERGEVVADAVEQLVHEVPLNQAGVNVADVVGKTWQRLRAKYDLADGKICVGFPGQSLLSRSFKLPPVDAKKIPELMKYETPRQIPVPVDKVAWDFHVFGADDSASRYDREAALFAVRQTVLRDRLALLESVDVRPDVLQADSLAIYNLLAYEGHWPMSRTDGADEEEVTMALDIGADTINTIIGHGQSVWTRSGGSGGNAFTKALVKELKLTHAEAERQKRQPFAVPAAHLLDQAMQPAFQSLLEEVHRTITYYGTQQRRRQVRRIILLGGGSRLHGLVEAFCLGR